MGLHLSPPHHSLREALGISSQLEDILIVRDDYIELRRILEGAPQHLPTLITGQPVTPVSVLLQSANLLRNKSAVELSRAMVDAHDRRHLYAYRNKATAAHRGPPKVKKIPPHTPLEGLESEKSV